MGRGDKGASKRALKGRHHNDDPTKGRAHPDNPRKGCHHLLSDPKMGCHDNGEHKRALKGRHQNDDPQKGRPNPDEPKMGRHHSSDPKMGRHHGVHQSHDLAGARACGVGLFKGAVTLVSPVPASLVFLELAASISFLADSGINSPSLRHMRRSTLTKKNIEKDQLPVGLAALAACTARPSRKLHAAPRCR
eukprot:586014-Pleurochrysis_carterae.AAC.1